MERTANISLTKCLWHKLIDCTLHWRQNERDGISNHRRLDCLLNRLFRHRSKKTIKLCLTGLCEGNPPATGGFSSQRASNAEIFPFDDVIMQRSYVTLITRVVWGTCNQAILSIQFRAVWCPNQIKISIETPVQLIIYIRFNPTWMIRFSWHVM